MGYGAYAGEWIHGYRLETPLSNQNAGMCKWGFARKDGRSFFLKQFLSPKYPLDNGKLDPALVAKKQRRAQEYFDHRKKYYDVLRQCRNGNIMIVEEFFREGSFYYISTERAFGPFLDMAQVSALPEQGKRVLLQSVLYSIAKLHMHRIIHTDLKPDNVLIKQTKAGFCTAKLIDFESGFLYSDPPKDIQGDQVYFSPEVVLHNSGEDTEITEKADIFALGILFHEYWSGHRPEFDREKYNYVSEAVIDGGRLGLDPSIDEDVRDMIARMLSRDPADRPSAVALWEALSGVRMPRTPGPGEGELLRLLSGGRRRSVTEARNADGNNIK